MKSLFRSRSNNANCSPRNLNANNDVLNTNVNNGGSFHFPESSNTLKSDVNNARLHPGVVDNVKDQGCETMKFMEAPVMDTEVAITNFPEPQAPIPNLEDVPFWDTEQPIPQAYEKKPVDINNLFDSITYEMVEAAVYSAFKGHNSKYDVRNFKKRLDKNIRKIYNSLLDGTYTRYIAYHKLQKYNHKGKLRLIDSPNLPLRILQHLWLLIVVPLYDRKDNGNGRNCKPDHGITAHQAKYGTLKPQKHLFYDLRHLHYVLVMDQRKCYEHITPKIYRKQIKRLLTDKKFIDFGEQIGFVNGKLPIGTPTSPYIHHICLLPSDWFIRDNTEWSLRYADNNVMAFRTLEEAQAFKWRLKNFWWYELNLRAKRQMTQIINIDREPLDNCGYKTYRNPNKSVSSKNKGYTLVRTTTVDRARHCRTSESWASYFGLMLHADAFNLMTKIENNMPDLRKLTEEIRIDREIDAPTLDVKDLLGIKFTLYKYRFKEYRGKVNWVQCLIGTKDWVESTAQAYDPKDPRKRAKSKTNKKQLKKVPRGDNQEYAWEFHGDYQGIIAYLKQLEIAFDGDTSKFLPITRAEIVKDGEYIFKGSTNKQRFINNS